MRFMNKLIILRNVVVDALTKCIALLAIVLFIFLLTHYVFLLYYIMANISKVKIGKTFS